jgi:hypothetical protein
VRVCAFEPQALAVAEQSIGARRSEWEDRLDRLDAFLKTLEAQGDNS